MESQLENEQFKGSQAQHAYDNFIKPFVQDKRELLFNAFSATGVNDTEALKTIKLQLYAIDQLELEILSIIDTGKMASKALEDQ